MIGGWLSLPSKFIYFNECAFKSRLLKLFGVDLPICLGQLQFFYTSYKIMRKLIFLKTIMDIINI